MIYPVGKLKRFTFTAWSLVSLSREQRIFRNRIASGKFHGNTKETASQRPVGTTLHSLDVETLLDASPYMYVLVIT